MCFKCFCEGKKKPIGREYFMYPLERPYMNLFFHKDCYQQIKGEILIYLPQNNDNMVKYYQNNKIK